MRGLRWAALCAAAMVLSGAGSATADPFFFIGSFETPDIPMGSTAFVPMSDGVFPGAGTPGIEIQDRTGLGPAPARFDDGGDQYAALSTAGTSSAYYELPYGVRFYLSFAIRGPVIVSLNDSVILDLSASPPSPSFWDLSGLPDPIIGRAGDHLTFTAAGAGKTYLDSVTLVAVPEPSTWAMLLAGFAVLGVAIRSRPRRAAQVA